VKSPRIVALSASAFAEDRAEAIDAGADAFLAKPFREEDLLEELRTQLGVAYEDDPSAAPSSRPDGADSEARPLAPALALTASSLRERLSHDLIGRPRRRPRAPGARRAVRVRRAREALCDGGKQPLKHGGSGGCAPF
jgi:CheY-like chemotaxis protein